MGVPKISDTWNKHVHLTCGHCGGDGLDALSVVLKETKHSLTQLLLPLPRSSRETKLQTLGRKFISRIPILS